MVDGLNCKDEHSILPYKQQIWAARTTSVLLLRLPRLDDNRSSISIAGRRTVLALLKSAHDFGILDSQ